MKPLLVSSGEPAGIGPDICLALADSALPLVVLADESVLKQRASLLRRDITFIPYQPDTPIEPCPGTLIVYPLPVNAPVVPGKLDHNNASFVINMLSIAAEHCSYGEFSGLVTAPISKEIINKAGFSFTGHTEFFAEYFHCAQVVMLLSCETFKVALLTTHLPLRKVADAITPELINRSIELIDKGLRLDFALPKPRIKVAGLNPHAGEGGYLGDEEIKIIKPSLEQLQKRGIDVTGPFSADTLFNEQNLNDTDVFVAMYHDQGLPVLKYAGFGQAVNITLGLPIVRTSVDHGTALELAGSGKASSTSLMAAVNVAFAMAQNRMSSEYH